jgi:hypothetical protein
VQDADFTYYTSKSIFATLASLIVSQQQHTLPDGEYVDQLKRVCMAQGLESQTKLAQEIDS